MSDRPDAAMDGMRAPRIYGPLAWKIGLGLARWIPVTWLRFLGVLCSLGYGLVRRDRRRVVERNLRLLGESGESARVWRVFVRFGVKLGDLMALEAGKGLEDWQWSWSGVEVLDMALREGRGAILVTLHLGNWEMGAPVLAQRGHSVMVVTAPEPVGELTQLRADRRRERGVLTAVVGEDPFSAVTILKHLAGGGVVAVLADRPGAGDSVEVALGSGRIGLGEGVAQLARGSGAPVIPVLVVQRGGGFEVCVLGRVSAPGSLRDPAGRRMFLGEIARAFGPVVGHHSDQWYHFIPILDVGAGG